MISSTQLNDNTVEMAGNSQNSNRIFKNTVVLYMRSLLVMLIALYTSRVILRTLGVEDFGLYNAVGGVVGLFSFFRTSMEKCTQRFLNVELVKEDGCVTTVFRVSFTIHALIAIVAFILLETGGLWFLNRFIQIPTGRVFAANCVYQSAVIGLVLTIMSIPFSASIIAHEKMTFFAVVSIVDAIFNLAIAIVIQFIPSDKLILYCCLVLVVNFINFGLYAVYCTRKFNEVTMKFLWEPKISKQMFSYTGWTLFGHTLIIGTNQGNTILVNMFHGVASNAAMAVASQVNRAVLNLTNSFQTAFNPQITKSYAAGDFQYLKSLVFATTKISYLLLLIISLPLMFNINEVLHLWLGEVPEYSGEFCILMLISGILQATSSPLNFCVMATGNIKWFQIVTGLVFVSDLIVLYALFSLGFPPTTAMYVKCSIMCLVCFVRLYFTRRQISGIGYGSYLIKIIIPLCGVTVISVIGSMLFMLLVKNLTMHLISIIVIGVITALTAYYIGLNKSEKALLENYINKIRRK